MLLTGGLVNGLLGLALVTAGTAPPVTEPDETLIDEGVDEGGVDDVIHATIDLGESVEGRPITAVHRPDPAGTAEPTTVLVIGVIHGDEPAGLKVVDRLADLPMPDGVELLLVDSMNPDGLADEQRGNANGVDLNRNFPHNWAPIAEPGDWEYAGTGPASEPETETMVQFISDVRPDLTIWYHQDLYLVPPSDGFEGEVRARYAELTDLPLVRATGGTYTGVAATWARHELTDSQPRPGVAFIVELGATLPDDEAEMHAAAVFTIVAEMF